MEYVLVKGVITGLILSFPFGPVGIYCMEKTMIKGQLRGYISALGMITIDILYGLTALLFISQVEDFIKKYDLLLKLMIAVFLILIGVKKIFGQVKIKKIQGTTNGIIKDYFTTFFLSIANISGILTILAIFTTLHLYNYDDTNVPIYASLGIFLGGATEWFITTYILSHFTKSLNEEKLINLSKLSGCLIFIFGVLILAYSIFNLIF